MEANCINLRMHWKTLLMYSVTRFFKMLLLNTVVDLTSKQKR